MRISELKNLGSKSEEQLSEIGISCAEDLHQSGAVEAYVKLKLHFKEGISANFLYAMEAALRDVHWQEITKQDKAFLQTEVESLLEIYEQYSKY